MSLRNATNFLLIRPCRSLFQILKENFLIILLFAVLAAIPYAFYKTPIFNYYLFNGQFNPTVYFSVWFPGYGGFYSAPPIFRYIFSYILEHLLPITTVSKIYFILPLFIAGISMYGLCKRFLLTTKVPAILGAIVYMYDVNGQALSYSPPEITLALGFLPAITGYWLVGDKKNGVIRSSIVVALIFLLMAPVNFTLIAIFILLAFLIIIFKVLTSVISDAIRSIKVIICSLALSFIITLPYYGTTLMSFFLEIGRSSYLLGLETPVWLNSASTIMETLRLMGSPDIVSPTHPQFAPFIGNPIMIIMTFLFPVFAAIALIYTARKTQYSIFFGLLMFLSTAMAAGGNSSSPTSGIYMWFYGNVPFFSIFRDSYKFVIFLSMSYSALFALFLHHFHVERKESKSKKKFSVYRIISYVLVLILILSVSYQFWGGTFLQNETFQTPSYWETYGHQLDNNKGDFRILLTPISSFPAYTWMVNPGNHPEYYLAWTNNRALALGSGVSSHNYLILNQTYSALATRNASLFLLDLYLMNVEYVTVQFDLRYQQNGALSPNQTEIVLQKMGFQHIETLGNLSEYEIPNAYGPSHVIALHQATCLRVSQTNELSISNLSCITKNLLPVSYVQNDPFSYSVQVNATGPYWLIFSESFDPGWQMYFGNISPFYPTGVAKETHFELNNFSNAWLVNDSRAESITLFFTPETSFLWFILLSWSIFPIMLIIIWICYRTRLEIKNATNKY